MSEKIVEILQQVSNESNEYSSLYFFPTIIYKNDKKDISEEIESLIRRYNEIERNYDSNSEKEKEEILKKLKMNELAFSAIINSIEYKFFFTEKKIVMVDDFTKDILSADYNDHNIFSFVINNFNTPENSSIFKKNNNGFSIINTILKNTDYSFNDNVHGHKLTKEFVKALCEAGKDYDLFEKLFIFGDGIDVFDKKVNYIFDKEILDSVFFGGNYRMITLLEQFNFNNYNPSNIDYETFKKACASNSDASIKYLYVNYPFIIFNILNNRDKIEELFRIVKDPDVFSFLLDIVNEKTKSEDIFYSMGDILDHIESNINEEIFENEDFEIGEECQIEFYEMFTISYLHKMLDICYEIEKYKNNQELLTEENKQKVIQSINETILYIINEELNLFKEKKILDAINNSGVMDENIIQYVADDIIKNYDDIVKNLNNTTSNEIIDNILKKYIKNYNDEIVVQNLKDEIEKIIPNIDKKALYLNKIIFKIKENINMNNIDQILYSFEKYKMNDTEEMFFRSIIKTRSINKLILLLEKNKDYKYNINIGNSLVEAIKEGFMDIVNLLLSQKNLKINEEIIFDYAWDNKNEKLIEFLLSRPNLKLNETMTYKSEMLLITAFEKNYKKVIELLISREDFELNRKSFGFYPTYLDYAYETKNEKMVELLLSQPGLKPEVARVSGDQLFSWAFKKGYTKIIKLLFLRKDIKLEKECKDKDKQLYYSIEYGWTEIVKELLNQKDIDINKVTKGDTPLKLAVENGHVEIVKLLLEKGANINEQYDFFMSPIKIAVKRDKKEMIEFLLSQPNLELDEEKGIYLGRDFIITWAIEKGYTKVIELLLKKTGMDVNAKINKKSLLYLAIENKKIESVRFLLSQPNINIDNSLLHEAVRFGSLNIVEELLKQKDIDVNVKDKSGITPLFWAVTSGRKDIANLLLQQTGIDKSAAIILDRKDPLYNAVFSGNLEVVQNLIKQSNEKINARDINTRTLLHIAAEKGYTEIVQELLNQDCIDIYAKTYSYGYTPLDLAIKKEHTEIAKLLFKKELDDIKEINNDIKLKEEKIDKQRKNLENLSLKLGSKNHILQDLNNIFLEFEKNLKEEGFCKS